MTQFFEWRDAPRADYAVVGDPVAHSLSPRMHRQALEAHGVELSYVAVRVPAGELSHALQHLASAGYHGVNVTLPLKEEAFAWAVDTDAFSRRVRPNTLSLAKREGINTDGPGFVRTLENLSLPPGCRTLVLGAGGTARTVVAALSDAGHEIAIWNRTEERARDLIEHEALWHGSKRPIFVEQAWTEGFDLVVNATSAEATGRALPVVWGDGCRHCVAYDLMYALGPTAFLRQAAAHAWQPVDGKELLVQQGALSLEWWLDRPAPIDAMREAIA